MSESPLASLYATGRRDPGDLYPSERRFLPWLAAHAQSVLDVGCATGGFASIWHAFAPDVVYRGVDRDAALVADARRSLGDAVAVSDWADGLPFPDRSADVVQALGWLHWEHRLDDALAELWRVTGTHLFFDLRLHGGHGTVEGQQTLENGTSFPYLVRAWDDAARAFLRLRPARILGYGYVGPPAPSAAGIGDSVCFATFVLERNGSQRPVACVELPLALPDALADEADVLDARELSRLVPA